MKDWMKNENLKRLIQKKELVVFAGAGVTKSLGLPDWKGFVIDVLKELSKQEPSFSDYVELIQRGNKTPIEIFDMLEHDYRKEIKQYVARKFNLSTTNTPCLHKNLINLTQKIVTTNYDNAFELAYTQLYGKGCPCVAIQNNDSINLSEIVRNAPEFIFKLHGCTSQPDSCVVFTSDYRKIYKKDSPSCKLLEVLSLTKTILFIGTSLSDKEIKIIFEEGFYTFGNNNTLTPKPEEYGKYSYLKPIKLNYEEWDDFFQYYASFNKPLEIEKTLSKIDEISRNLKGVGLFRGVSSNEIEKIIRNTKSKIYQLPKDRSLCEKDDKVSSFWLILNGSIAAYKDGVITAVRQKGSIVGELGLLEGRTARTSKLVAHEHQTEVLEIGLESIRNLRPQSQAILWKNLASMLGGKVEKLDKLVSILQKTIDEFRIEKYDE